MIHSRKFVAAAIGAALGVMAAGLVIGEYEARASTAPSEADVAADRIGGAFATIAENQPDSAVETQAVRGDLGGATRVCASATWPNVDTSCLTTADGSPVHPVRMITVGYQTDANTTVLLRVPGTDASTQ